MAEGEIRTEYQVQVMEGLNKWDTIFSTENEYDADEVAGPRSDQKPLKHVRILEIQFKKGRLNQILEYKMNPSHCSNNGLPPRGPEKYLRGSLA